MHRARRDVAVRAFALVALCARVEHFTRRRIDVEFHALIARASRNRSLMLAREPFSLLYRPALKRLIEALPTSAARNVQAHEIVLAALRKRDAKRAEEWMRKHLIDFRAGFLKADLPMDAPIDTLGDHGTKAVEAAMESVL